MASSLRNKIISSNIQEEDEYHSRLAHELSDPSASFALKSFYFERVYNGNKATNYPTSAYQ